jgi:predicted nucleic acid-binding protein
VIVYVETNFLLELAYLQERCESCRELVELARRGSITLAMPAFCAAEARATWHRRAGERGEFFKSSKKHIDEIARSQPFRELSRKLREIVTALASGNEESRERLEIAIMEIEDYGTLIPMTAELLVPARINEIDLSLSPPDALVLASVQSHARGERAVKCFATQDAKGFANPAVQAELVPMNCRVIANFADALAYVRSTLSPSA